VVKIQTPIAPIVHPKMNSGKEPFKCGMESAECGVRPNLISVIAKLRATSRRDPLPLRHSECRSSLRKSAQTSPLVGMMSGLTSAATFAIGVAAFGRKPPFEFPPQFAALCRDAATAGFWRDKSAHFPCGIWIPIDHP
jgi:predicted small lipoprotein YifL